MKKILIVMTSLYNGGAERSLVNFLNEMEEGRFQIDLLLFKKSGMFMKQVPEWVNILDTPKDLQALYTPTEIRKNAFSKVVSRYIGTGISKLFTSNSREQRGMRWKYFYSREIDKLPTHYDVALAYISGEILYYVSEKVNATKKIVWIHNDYRSAQHPKKYDLPHLEKMDKIVSISDNCVDILKEEFPHLANRVYMLPNITSSIVVRNRAEEFYPTEYEKNTFKILSIGRLYSQKGFDIAIDAAKILKQNKYDFCWYIIGTGEEKEIFEKQIKENDVEDNVKLLGSRENPYPYIKNCDLFVQSSRYEGKSVVLDEAKIIGTTILSTNYPTVGDQLKNNEEGIIVDMSAEGLYSGIKYLIDYPDQRERLKNNLLQNEYGNQSEISKYISLIEK